MRRAAKKSGYRNPGTEDSRGSLGPGAADELIESWFGELGVMRSQWVDEHKNPLPFESERRLLFGFMENNMRDYASGKRRYQHEVRAWVEDEGAAPFSFTAVCEFMKVDPDAARQRFKLWMDLVDLRIWQGRKVKLGRKSPVLAMREIRSGRRG